MSFAKVIIVGRLGGDPESRQTPNGAVNVQFSIAADGRRKGENVTWFRCTAWEPIAGRLQNVIDRGYVAKGSLLYVEGQLESRVYTDRNGQERTSTDVTVTDFQFVGGGQQQGDRRDDARQDFRQGGESYTDINSLPF